GRRGSARSRRCRPSGGRLARLRAGTADQRANQVDHLEAETRAEEALPGRGDRALAGREVPEVHPAAHALALPLAVRNLVGELAGDGGPEARRLLEAPGLGVPEVVDDGG